MIFFDHFWHLGAMLQITNPILPMASDHWSGQSESEFATKASTHFQKPSECPPLMTPALIWRTRSAPYMTQKVLVILPVLCIWYYHWQPDHSSYTSIIPVSLYPLILQTKHLTNHQSSQSGRKCRRNSSAIALALGVKVLVQQLSKSLMCDFDRRRVVLLKTFEVILVMVVWLLLWKWIRTV